MGKNATCEPATGVPPGAGSAAGPRRGAMNFTACVCAGPADQRRALADLIAEQRAVLPIQRVFFAYEDQRPATGAVVTRVPRLSLPLVGRHPFEINVGDGAGTLRLEPGEALFMLPGSWRRALFDEVRTHTAMVFESGYVWFFAQHCAPTAPVQPQLWCHTPQPIVPEGLDLIHALSAIARSGRNLAVAPQLVRILVEIAHAQLADASALARDAGEGLWKGICTYVSEHYHRPLDRETVAAAFDVHPNHVSRLFGRHSREGFNQFLVRTRLENATALLRNSRLTVEEVALRCGFRDDNYFRHSFRRFFGMPPGRFRDRAVALPDATTTPARSH
jgi:AraC-like DNA-binding protein